MAINPETSAWVRELLQQEIERAVAPLRQEIDQVDDWANGVFAALEDVLLPLLKERPDLARKVQPLWRLAAQRHEQLGRSPGQADDFHETAHLLEARKMLYWRFATAGVWEGVDPQKAALQTLERAGWQAPPDA